MLMVLVLLGAVCMQPIAARGPALTPGPAPNLGRGEEETGLLPLPASGEGRGEGHPHLQADARNVELVGQIGGTCRAVAVQGRYAYIGLGPRLAGVDISTPAHLALVGQSAILPDVVRDVAVSGSLVYVAGGIAGLRVIDVSDPAHPRGLGAYDTSGWAYGVALSGTLAYVADLYAGLAILRYVPPGRVSLFLPLVLVLDKRAPWCDPYEPNDDRCVNPWGPLVSGQALPGRPTG